MHTPLVGALPAPGTADQVLGGFANVGIAAQSLVGCGEQLPGQTAR